MKSTSADEVAKHMQEHRLGMPMEQPAWCGVCATWSRLEAEDAAREYLDYARSAR